MLKQIKKWSSLGCVSLGLVLGGITQAQAAYPEKPVKLVVNYPAGGYIDIVSRLVGEYASNKIGQPVIIENRPGAAGAVGGQYVARQPADGYTFLMGLDTLYTVNPYVYKNMNFSPTEDLEPISRVGSFNQVLLARSGTNINSLEEFLAASKDKSMFYSSSGVGTPGHLAMEMFNQTLSLDNEHAPYAGNAAAAQALLRGDVEVGFLAIGVNFQYIGSGDFVPLATSGLQRDERIPNVLTLQETGVQELSDFHVEMGHVMMAPKGTDAEVMQLWSQLIAEAFADPEIHQKLISFNLIPSTSSPEQTRTYLDKEAQRWQQVVETAGISLD